MNYPLPADLQQRIDAQLVGGGFASEEDVLREAIEALERRQHGLAQLRIAGGRRGRGRSRGPGRHVRRDEIKREVRDRLAERGIRD